MVKVNIKIQRANLGDLQVIKVTNYSIISYHSCDSEIHKLERVRGGQKSTGKPGAGGFILCPNSTHTSNLTTLSYLWQHNSRGPRNRAGQKNWSLGEGRRELSYHE